MRKGSLVPGPSASTCPLLCHTSKLISLDCPNRGSVARWVSEYARRRCVELHVVLMATSYGGGGSIQGGGCGAGLKPPGSMGG